MSICCFYGMFLLTVWRQCFPLFCNSLNIENVRILLFELLILHPTVCFFLGECVTVGKVKVITYTVRQDWRKMVIFSSTYRMFDVKFIFELESIYA